MTSTVKQATALPEWPLVMTCKEAGLVVLFSGYQHGVVLHPGDTAFFVGYSANDWRMNNFERFSGSIEITAVNGK